jgi:HAD superfamily hydrolase (TIGR01459 family)
MHQRLAPIAIIDRISDLDLASDAWLVDIWGVLHDGVTPHGSAVAACQAFRARGGTVVLISNAPRPASAVVDSLARIGVPEDVADGILTSGDVTRAMLIKAGTRRVHHIGPDRDLGIFAGLDIARVAAAEAEVIVCTGLLDDETETAETYRPTLEAYARQRHPFICANPDIVVERGKRLITCAGALAEVYAAAGGSVAYAGKPYGPIYDEAMAMIALLRRASVPRARVLAIGDGLKTDIAGATAAGIPAVYVRSGVHAKDGEPLSPALLARLFEPGRPAPVAAMIALA